jgi:hypothetical protein
MVGPPVPGGRGTSGGTGRAGRLRIALLTLPRSAGPAAVGTSTTKLSTKSAVEGSCPVSASANANVRVQL